MEKLKVNFKLALVILIGYAAHQSNPQYQFADETTQVRSQANIHQQDMAKRPCYCISNGAQTNSREAFSHWAQAYQQRLNQNALTAKRD